MPKPDKDKAPDPVVEPVDPEPQPDPAANDGPPEPQAQYAEPDPDPNAASDPEDAVGEDGVRRDVDLPDELVPAGDAIESVEGQAAKQATPVEPGYSLQQAYEGNLDEDEARSRGINLDTLVPEPDNDDEKEDSQA